MINSDRFSKIIPIVIDQLCEVAAKGSIGNNIDTAIAEVTIKGIDYQIQISLVSDKKMWVKEDEVRFSEVVKIHDKRD